MRDVWSVIILSRIISKRNSLSHRADHGELFLCSTWIAHGVRSMKTGMGTGGKMNACSFHFIGILPLLFFNGSSVCSFSSDLLWADGMHELVYPFIKENADAEKTGSGKESISERIVFTE